MKNYFTTIFVIIFLIITQISFAQDFHFSQFENAPINLNPALSGIYNGQHRLILNYKHESNDAIKDNGFRTTSISYDTRFKTSKKSFLGVGLNLINDKAAASDFGTDEYKLTTSYVLNFSKDAKAPQFISFGLDFGITQRTIDLTNAQWPSQHNGNGGFNPNLPGGTIQDNGFIHPELGIGLLWEKSMRNNNAIRIGFAMHHANRAKISFLGDDIRLNTKYTIQGSGELKIKENLTLLPSIIFFSQGSTKQLMVGGSARLYFNPKSTFKYFQIGAWHKTVELQFGSVPSTFTFLLETQIKKLKFALSHDRRKSDAFSSKGIEFSLGYLFN